MTNNVYLTKEEVWCTCQFIDDLYSLTALQENVVKLIKAGMHFNSSLEKKKSSFRIAIGHRFAPAALHKIQPEEAGCMPGTRVSILSMFLEWAKNDPMRIFWLAGLAGTGKTSIAVTLCRMLENDPNVVLGGSFFCSRTANVNELTDARCILPTLAVAFAEKSSAFAKALAAEIKADSSSALSPILTLIKPLLQRPLASVASSELPIIFVIDALDECSDENEVKTLLRAISILECETKVKFIVTSRPETHISTSPISSSDQNSILRLHTIDKTQVTEDIRLYITDAFSKQPLQASWYTEADLNLLATHAEGLFIFASTVVTYLLDAGSVKSRAARLRTAIFAINSSKVVTRPLDAMYEFVLEQASNSEMVEPDELETTQKVLNCILTAKMPLSINVLAELLALDSDDLRDSLRRLRSVVHVPDETDQPGLRTVHASFGDYLFERAATKLRFVSALGNEALARGCLKVMVNRLHFNISQSRSSFEPNSQTKPDSVTYSLEYACLQWVYHLADAPQPWVMEHEVDDAFRSRLLFWLEVMSVLRQVQRAGAMLNLAVTLVRYHVV